ncbi:MAG: rhodanese-like domain-containing protein [Prevotella denticola]|uniref:rhodanese-like domain-containing protein n=1 Tax=Prevotella denticola TaxID=28129 RepID=UPI003FA07221
MRKTLTVILAVLGFSLGTTAQNIFENVDVNHFEQFIRSDSVQLVDVRTPKEYAEGHIAGAVNINVKDSAFLTAALSRFDKKRPCAVYCRSGKRSALAASLLAKRSFAVTNLLGGIIAWTEARKEITKE